MKLPSPSLGLRTAFAQIDSHPSILVATAILVSLAGLVLSILPRTLEAASSRDLHETVSQAHPDLQNLSTIRIGLYPPGPTENPMATALRAMDRFEQTEMPDSVSALITDRDLLVDSPLFDAIDLPGATLPADRDRTYVRFRHQESASEDIDLTAGRLPEPAGNVEVLTPCAPEEPECGPENLPLVEVALSEAIARELRLGIGDRLLLTANASDGLSEHLGPSALAEVRVVLEVSGTFQRAEEAGPLWTSDHALYEPSVVYETLDNRFVYATAWMSPNDYGRLAAVLSPGSSPIGHAYWRWESRYLIDPDVVIDSELTSLRRDLLGVRLAHGSAIPDTDARVFRTGLPELIDFHNAQRSQTLKLMSLVLAGVFSVVTASVLVLGVLMTERQRGHIALARDRGASSTQVAVTRLYQSFVMVAPFAAAAYFTAAALLPDTSGEPAAWASVTLAALGVLASVASVLSLARRPVGAGHRVHAWPRPPNPRRVVFEVMCAVLAVSALALVRRRDPTADPRIDWLFVAVPILVGTVVGLVAIRLVGPIATSLSGFFARRKSTVPFLGFRRITQQATATRIPLALLVICMATSAMCFLFLRSMTEMQVDDSWQAVGGDFSVTMPGGFAPLPDEVVSALDSLASGRSARATFMQTARLTGPRSQSVLLVAVDSDAYREMLPRALPDLAAGEAGVLTGLAASRLPVASGVRVEVEVGNITAPVDIVDTAENHPGVVSGRSFLVVDRDRLEAIAGALPPPTVLYIAGPETLGTRIREVVADSLPGAQVVSRHEVLAEVTGDPLVAWTMLVLSLAWPLAGAVGVLGVAAGLGLAAEHRQRDVGFLKTMGLTDRQSLAMALVEQLPGVVVATGLGLLSGAVVVLALEPAIDFSFFAGGNLPWAMTVDWWLLGNVFVVSVALLVVAGGMLVALNRRRELGSAVRIGDE